MRLTGHLCFCRVYRSSSAVAGQEKAERDAATEAIVSASGFVSQTAIIAPLSSTRTASLLSTASCSLLEWPCDEYNPCLRRLIPMTASPDVYG